MLPTTKLEAVNIMLASIGEAPVSTLDSGLVDAEMAETILDATSRSVQSKGWHFNTEVNFTLQPDIDGYLYVPASALRVDPVDKTLDLVHRGIRLYDRGKHTYVIKEPVVVDFVNFLALEELPEAARRYITLKAARTFQDRVVGNSELHGFQQADEYEAYAELKAAEASTGDYNILNNGFAASILDRRPSSSGSLRGGRFVSY